MSNRYNYLCELLRKFRPKKTDFVQKFTFFCGLKNCVWRASKARIEEGNIKRRMVQNKKRRDGVVKPRPDLFSF